MARKDNSRKLKTEEKVETLITPEEKEVFERVKEDVKTASKPQAKKLGIIEVAKSMTGYRKSHDPVILAFCKSRGFETEGKREDLINSLKAFGYRQ